MKRTGYELLILFAAIFASCASQPAADPASSPTPAVPAAEFVKTEGGRLVKKGGWEFPRLKTRPKPERIQIGHQWVTTIRNILSPNDKVTVKAPNFIDNKTMEYAVSKITEISGEGQNPICYQLMVTRIVPGAAQPEGIPTYIYFIDDDGDGSFETLADRCTVPSWVK